MAVKFGALTPALTSAQFEAATRSRKRRRRRRRNRNRSRTRTRG